MERKAMFIVETENTVSGEHWNYYEDAYTAQGAVNKVRTYKADTEKIINVYRQIENWK